MKQNQRKKLSVLNVGKKGHTTPNCKKQKINALSDDEDEDRYHKEASEESISSDNSSEIEKAINSKNKIENCLCQINMLTTDQEILVDMIDHIEVKEAKEKFLRKIMEQSNKNTLPLQNSYKFKDIMKQFEIQKPITIQDLQIEIKQIRIQIEELKSLLKTWIQEFKKLKIKKYP